MRVDPDTILQMGLSPISHRQWIEPFDARVYQQFADHKHAILAKQPNAILVDPTAVPALKEWYGALKHHLKHNHSGVVSECGISVDGAVPQNGFELLEKITHWVPDDMCILLEDEAGEYRLQAASVLSPSLWDPALKFRQTLAFIHESVPRFERQLMPRMNRFFRHIKADRPVVRYNWAVQRGDVLYRVPERVASETDTGTAPLFYRVERQSLLRLPNTNAVVFIIRTLLTEMTQEKLNEVLQAIRLLPEDERRYKGLDRIDSGGFENRQCVRERMS